MRILVDEDLDVRLRLHFGDDHDASTVYYHGWSGITNGDLLAAASAEFDVLVTADANLRHQQDVSKHGIAVLVLRGPTKRLSDLLPLMPEVLRVLPNLRPGTVTEVGTNPPSPSRRP